MADEAINWPAADLMSQWLNDNVAEPYKEQPLAQDWARLSKIGEEYGEAVEAFIGVTGQNPRKGITHDWDDVMAELADTALTAIYCMVHMQGADAARDALVARQRRHNDRVGLAWPGETLRQVVTAERDHVPMSTLSDPADRYYSPHA